MTDADVFLAKAEESLKGAESEYTNGRYNNCANRYYYACFQAAVAALINEGVRPSGDGQWSHTFVQAKFAGLLVNRRKLITSELRYTLVRAMDLRHDADYRSESVTQIVVLRNLRRTRSFVAAIAERSGTPS